MTMSSSTSPLMEDAFSNWLVGHDSQAPTDTEAQSQKHWDHLRSLATAIKLEESATDDIDRARLLASRSGESGAWLHTLPIATMGLLLDDDSLRIAVGLRLYCTEIWMTILESGWNLWVWLVGVVSRRWVWLVGGIYGYGYHV